MGCLCSGKKAVIKRGDCSESASPIKEVINIHVPKEREKKESFDSKFTPVEIKVERKMYKNETSKISTDNFTSKKKTDEKQVPISTEKANVSKLSDDNLIKKSHLEVQNSLVPDIKRDEKLNSSLLILKNISRNPHSRRGSKFEEIVEVDLEAQAFEIMVETWCLSNAKISFEIIGKWKADKELEEVDSRGYFNQPSLENKFPLGALIGRIGGENTSFIITNKFEYLPLNSGPLFMSMNIDNFKMKPEGYLKIKIKNTTKTSKEEIDKKLGWKIPANKIDFLSEVENEILTVINKIRSNPSLFAKIYLSHLIETSENIKSLYKRMQELKSLPELTFNKKLKIISDKLCDDLSTSGKFSHEDSEDNDALKRLKNLLPEEGDIKVYESVCVYSINHPLHLVLKLLIDEQVPSKVNRENLLNENVLYIGMSMKTHQKWGWVSVIDFSVLNY